MTPIAHGLHSTTFTQPPLDGSLCLPALFDWQGSHSAKHPLFVFEDVPGSLRKILWEEGIQGMHRATEYIRRAVGQGADTAKKPVIAILAASDTITFATFLAGAMRTSWTIFPISTRNSVPAVAALLSQTGATHIFVSGDNHNQGLATAALKEVPDGSAVIKHDMPVFEDLYPSIGVDPNFVSSPLPEFNLDETLVVIHSSGSTSFPKPIYLAQNALVSAMELTCYGEVDLAGRVFSYHGVPMFHAMGLACLSTSTGSGVTIATFKPQAPAIIPNPDNVFQQALATECHYMLATPTFVETWAQSESTVESLKKMEGVIYAGGPLSKDAGDRLASRGVNVYTGYGLTETMTITNFLPTVYDIEPPGMDWEYFQVSPVRKVHCIEHGDNEYELVVLATGSYSPSVINIQINGQNGMATGDLVSPHPTKEGHFRIVGRADDQIMHSTGEKTNPTPLEKMLKKDSLVGDVLMFGRGRFHCGVLVQPKPQFAFDPSDTAKLAEFRSLIWPTVEKMNAFAPSHSRLFKEMIIVAHPFKPFTYTAKGSLRRQAITKEYAAEIEAAYAAVDESSQDDIARPTEWSETSTAEFVRRVVEQTMKINDSSITDDVDLFEFGLDSLQATWIRNSILRVLRETHPSIARSLSSNFVYDHPTIFRLTQYLYSAVTGVPSKLTDGANAKRHELRALVDKYTQTFPTFKGGRSSLPDGAVVLITGSTGSLGSNILAKLLQNAGVKRVYAMSRPSSDGEPAKERHVKAFEREALDVKLLDDAKVQFFEGDASHADFAIDRQHFEELQSSVTHIVHNGWRVNFNVAVSSFESNIRSVRNFVDFSLGGPGPTPARVIFISSIGVFQGYSEKKLGPEAYLAQPDSAIGTGYAESKWVSEQILQRTSQTTPLSSTVVRCGQMTGGPSGAWNEHEWFPSLVKSSVVMNKLPDTDGIITFINAYDAAGAVVDMLDAKEEEVVHIVHPHPVSWSSVIGAFSNVLGIPTVPYSDWLRSLEEAAAAVPSDAAAIESAHRSNPALRLLPFFRAFSNVQDECKEALGFPRLSCEKATAVSQSMQHADSLGERDVKRWVASWKKSGFL